MEPKKVNVILTISWKEVNVTWWTSWNKWMPKWTSKRLSKRKQKNQKLLKLKTNLLLLKKNLLKLKLLKLKLQKLKNQKKLKKLNKSIKLLTISLILYLISLLSINLKRKLFTTGLFLRNAMMSNNLLISSLKKENYDADQTLWYVLYFTQQIF